MSPLGDPIEFLQSLILKIPALLLAVTIHELAHGYTAERLGDPTPRLEGRLTLNPLPHIDPFGALAFVIAGFGWAKPVNVEPRYFRRPVRDMALVGAAGPVSNFLTAFAVLLALEALLRLGAPSFVAAPLLGVLRWAYLFNLALGIFNLIPLPPLDGGHLLPYILPRGAYWVLDSLRQYGFLILLLLVFSGATRYLVLPPLLFLDAFYRGLLGLLL